MHRLSQRCSICHHRRSSLQLEVRKGRKGGEERHRIWPVLPLELVPLMPDSATIAAIWLVREEGKGWILYGSEIGERERVRVTTAYLTKHRRLDGEKGVPMEDDGPQVPPNPRALPDPPEWKRDAGALSCGRVQGACGGQSSHTS